MEGAAPRSRRARHATLAAFALIAFALIGALILMHNADAADRAERARIQTRLDELSKQMTTLQAQMASAPIPTVPVPPLADAAVGDFPLPPKANFLVQPKDPPAPTRTRGGGDPGY